MLSQTIAASGVVLIALFGLATSNLLFDRGVSASLSRRVPGVLGGVAFLIAVLWLDPWTAVALSGALTLSILVLRLRFGRGLRGVTGNASAQAWAEVSYPLAGTLSLAIGWGLLGDKWLAFMPIGFMAWGDNVVGLTRVTIWRGRMAQVWPSIAMLGVCLVAALLFQPYWISAVGALTATVAERFSPITNSIWDDNWVVVAASLAVMGALTRVVL